MNHIAPLVIDGPAPGIRAGEIKGTYYIRVPNEIGGYAVGEAYGNLTNTPLPAEANARLWAAAHELLAFAKEFKAFLARDDYSFMHDSEFTWHMNNLAEHADKAITKAETPNG